MSVRNEQAGRIARIIKCDYIYMTVLSPLTGTSPANYKIWKWDNLIVKWVTIICDIWRQCWNTILSVLTQLTSTGNATTYFREKWMILESMSRIWVLKYSSACPHHVFHPSAMYVIMLCQPLLELQFSFLYLLPLSHGNTSYKWNSGFHTLSTTSRVGPGVTCLIYHIKNRSTIYASG
jgi:hypothetical protein